MNDETCPHCHAARQYPHSRYECGVLVNRSDARTARCYERREAALEAENEMLREQLAYCVGILEIHMRPGGKWDDHYLDKPRAALAQTEDTP